MRGVAALAIVLYHLALALRPGFLPHAYLAVDFFFMLSGFVLWQAYAPRLRHGLTPLRFMLLRLVRLYPLFAAGTAIGALGLAVLLLADPARALSGPATAATIFLNFLMLPSPSQAALFPANLPAWSLFQELLVNAAFAVALVRISGRLLALIVGSLAVLYLWWMLASGSADFGGEWATLLPGLVRTGFGFSLGLLIAHQVRHRMRESLSAILAPLALFAILCAPTFCERASLQDALYVFLLLPLLLWFSARRQLPNFARPAGAFLGDISYALYAVHFPLLQAGLFVARRIHIPDVAAGAIYVAGLLVLASWLSRAFDLPARTWASRRLRLRVSALPATQGASEGRRRPAG